MNAAPNTIKVRYGSGGLALVREWPADRLPYLERGTVLGQCSDSLRERINNPSGILADLEWISQYWVGLITDEMWSLGVIKAYKIKPKWWEGEPDDPDGCEYQVFSEGPKVFDSWDHFRSAPGPEGLNDPSGERFQNFLDSLAPKYRQPIEQALFNLKIKSTPKIGEHRRPTKEEQNDKDSKNENGILIKGGNNAAYRIAKLKRDHRDIADRLEAGEYKSVSAAERAAGIRPPKLTRVERLAKAYQRLDEAQRAEFWELIK